VLDRARIAHGTPGAQACDPVRRRPRPNRPQRRRTGSRRQPPIADGELEPWASSLRELAGQPNTVCELSGFVTEAVAGAPTDAFRPVADVVIAAFGPERVMFGSDWPVCLLASDYASVVELTRTLVADLSEAERAAVFAGTAARVYGI
jgi:L-fuconolactonase